MKALDKNKVYRIFESIRESGFFLTRIEFYTNCMKKLFKQYGIDDKLNNDEMNLLVKLILQLCDENDLKEMGFGYYEEDEFRYK